MRGVTIFPDGMDEPGIGHIPKFVPVQKRPIFVDAQRMPHAFEVKTLEGTMRGKAGDWLICGVESELYPCDADIFEKTYEVITK